MSSPKGTRGGFAPLAHVKSAPASDQEMLRLIAANELARLQAAGGGAPTAERAAAAANSAWQRWQAEAPSGKGGAPAPGKGRAGATPASPPASEPGAPPPPESAAAAAAANAAVAADLARAAARAAAPPPPPLQLPAQQTPTASAPAPAPAGRTGRAAVGDSLFGARSRSASPAKSPAKRGSAAARSAAGGAPSEPDWGSDSDFDGGRDDGTPWYRRRRFWLARAAPAAASLACVAAGALILVLQGGSGALEVLDGELQVWRLLFFLGGLPWCWWAGDAASRALVWAVERSMFTVRNALYYAYTSRKPGRALLRALLVLGWWALIMGVATGSRDAAVQEAYEVGLQVLGCVAVFAGANLLKTVLASMTSTKFQARQQDRMRRALYREHLLHQLLQPRSELGGGAGAGDGDGSPGLMARATSAPAAAARGLLAALGVSRRAASHPAAGGGGAGDPPPPPSFKKVGSMSKLFWRRSQKDLHRITEEAETSRPGSPPGSPPPPAVAISIDGGGAKADARGGAKAADKAAAAAAAAAAGVKPPQQPSPFEAHGSPRSHRSSVTAGGARTRPGQSGRASAGGGGARRAVGLDLLKPGAGGGAGGGGGGGARRDRAFVANRMARLERYIRRNALEVSYRDALNRTVQTEEVATEADAKKLAFFLFWNVKADWERESITLDDLRDFLSDDDAAEAFAWLASQVDDGADVISLADCAAAAVAMMRERRVLAKSLTDTRSIVKTLERLIGGLLHFLCVFIYLAIWQLDVNKAYLAMSSIIVSFAFVFGSSMRAAYENVIFLFVVHPYDVGDSIYLEGATGPYLDVEEITLNFTVFRARNGRRTYLPNTTLAASTFINVTTSGDYGESVAITVDLNTPQAALEELRAAAAAFIATHLAGEVDSVALNFNNPRPPLKVDLAVWIAYTHNGLDVGRVSAARTRLMSWLAGELERLHIKCEWPGGGFVPQQQ